MRVLSSAQTLTFFNCSSAAVTQRPVGGGVGRGGWLNMWQRDSIWCYLPEECHRCFLSPAAVCSASATQEWCHWRYYELLSNLQRSETQINATQKCKQTHLSSVEVSQRRPEFFFDFSEMFFLSHTNWWGVPGIQPLMSLRVTESHWDSLLPFRTRPLCGSLHGVRTKYNDITPFPLRSSPFPTRPPHPRWSTQLVRLVRHLKSTVWPQSPCHAPAVDHVSWRSDTNTTQTNYTTSDNGSCHTKLCRLSMQQPVEHKLEVIRLSLQLEHTTIETKCYFQRRVEDSRDVFLDLRSLCLSSKGLHQCPLTGEEAQVLDLLKRCRHRSLRTQVCGAGTKPFLNQDRGLVAFHSTHQISRLQAQIKQPEDF